MSSKLEELREILMEMFQFDQADLDFGIYRIINQKREEIKDFMDNRLLPEVKEAFKQYQAADKAAIQKELDELKQQLEAAGVEPEHSKKYTELQAKLDEAVDVTGLENEVYSHLTSFFRRYYEDGDFHSLRRYKKDVYAIPYEGEEVKLYWANADQYYIKTTEHFRNYTFTLPSGRRVHFKLVDASTEKDNNKEPNGKERRFMLVEDQPMVEENGELFIRFVYQPAGGKVKQTDLNAKAVERIFNEPGFSEWCQELAELKPTPKNGKRTLLEKHLNEYTARNSFDYFIHKDLGGFLRRELDFYIKNEIMFLDDLDTENEVRFEQYISKIRVVKRIANKIITFLEQLENFQKKLWLKKKFVVESNYCITLDRVPEELYPEIIANQEQIEEWKRLFAIDEITGGEGQPGYTEPLTDQFLKANPYLMIDTAFFDQKFKEKLLGSIDNLDENIDGLLIHSENFQALNVLSQKYRESVKCVYIDPPFNAKSSEILYKNSFKHSSWLSLMENRITISKEFMLSDCVYVIAVDEVEQERLGMLIDKIFPEHKKTNVTVIINPSGQQGNNFSTTHEFACFVYPNKKNIIALESRSDENADVRGFMNGAKGDTDNYLRESGQNCFYSIVIDPNKLEVVEFGDVPDKDFHPKSSNIRREDGLVEVYPIDTDGIERKWLFARQSVEDIFEELNVKFNKKSNFFEIIRIKQNINYKH